MGFLPDLLTLIEFGVILYTSTQRNKEFQMTLAQIEQQRRQAAQALGVRYYKLTKSQAMEALVKANAPKRTGSPFPA